MSATQFSFLRDEFDRYVRWDSWGSATEFFNWENMCEVRISVPPIEEQRKAVASWQGLRKMKAYNDNLKDQLATVLTTLLYTEGYPPDWDDEVFHRVLEQMENYKRHQGQ